MIVLSRLLRTGGAGQAVKIKRTITLYKCERCGHEWQPLKPQEPRVCPKCKSPYWNVPRRKGTARKKPSPE